MSGRRGSNPAIYFLSDYGIADEFVGVVHAVLHRLAPTSTVIDLSHLVAPFDVQAGADLLERSLPHLGPGVVLAVVDPGVGTARRAVAVAVESVDGPQWLVGPDNGILLPAADALGPVTRAVGLEARALAIGRTASPGPAGATFDGRDLFAPAAAHLVLGEDPSRLGPDLDPTTLVRIQPGSGPVASRPDLSNPSGLSGLSAEVGWIDRFGNAQLRSTPAALSDAGLAPGDRAVVSVRSDDGSGGPPTAARWVGAFAELGPGELGLMVDANGRPALVVDRSSAARLLALAGPGTVIEITPAPGPAD